MFEKQTIKLINVHISALIHLERRNSPLAAEKYRMTDGLYYCIKIFITRGKSGAGSDEETVSFEPLKSETTAVREPNEHNRDSLLSALCKVCACGWVCLATPDNVQTRLYVRTRDHTLYIHLYCPPIDSRGRLDLTEATLHIRFLHTSSASLMHVPMRLAKNT